MMWKSNAYSFVSYVQCGVSSEINLKAAGVNLDFWWFEQEVNSDMEQKGYAIPRAEGHGTD
jgi:hypothetical protein